MGNKVYETQEESLSYGGGYDTDPRRDARLI
jgi:hypothetical protein